MSRTLSTMTQRIYERQSRRWKSVQPTTSGPLERFALLQQAATEYRCSLNYPLACSICSLSVHLLTNNLYFLLLPCYVVCLRCGGLHCWGILLCFDLSSCYGVIQWCSESLCYGVWGPLNFYPAINQSSNTDKSCISCLSKYLLHDLFVLRQS